MNLEELLHILQENKMLAGYLVVGLLFIILLTFLFIKSFSIRKQASANASTTSPLLADAHLSLFSIDNQSIKDFLTQLRQVSNESQKIIEKLELQIEQKRQQIEEKTAYMNELEQQLASMPIEQLVAQHAEKLRKDYEKKMNTIEVKYRARSTQMWVWGFITGVILLGLVIATYYFLFLKST